MASSSSTGQVETKFPEDDYDFDYDEDDVEDDEGYIPGGGTDLEVLETRLRTEVDDEFFMDPRRFNTLPRVIDVLRAQMDDSNNPSLLPPPQHHHHPSFQQHQQQPPPIMTPKIQDLETLRRTNPAYRALQKQKHIVEEAIEHMAVRYCADLNGAVVQVGKVARQFSDAVSMVRRLRRQVRDIKETLGSCNPIGSNASSKSKEQQQQQQQQQTTTAAMSLRELWLKKLECEAVLGLLEKMEIVRSAPREFDRLVSPPGPCRIGAGVCILSRAFEIAFHTDASSVRALQNAAQSITNRKHRADTIIWETLLDVIFLRTGNGLLMDETKNKSGATNLASSTTNANSSSNNNLNNLGGSNTASATTPTSLDKDKVVEIILPSSAQSVSSDEVNTHGMKNPFITKHRLLLASTDVDDDDDDDSMESWFSRDDDETPSTTSKANIKKLSSTNRTMIPTSLLEAELDLEADERRCLEEVMAQREWSMWDDENTNRNLPRYADHVLALRILVECLYKLNKLDDVQRTLADSILPEIRKIAQKEQAKTFGRLEKTNNAAKKRRKGTKSPRGDLKDFRRHLTGLLSSFGCVLLRLAHLSQILRYRIVSTHWGSHAR